MYFITVLLLESKGSNWAIFYICFMDAIEAKGFWDHFFFPDLLRLLLCLRCQLQLRLLLLNTIKGGNEKRMRETEEDRGSKTKFKLHVRLNGADWRWSQSCQAGDVGFKTQLQLICCA